MAATRMFSRLLLALLLLTASPALAQVFQSGNVTPNHPAMWIAPGIIGDAGPATAGNLTNLGITANGGLPFCLTTGPTSGAYDQLCLSVTSGGVGQLSLQNFNGAAAIPFQLLINGTVYSFSAGGGLVTSVTAGTGISVTGTASAPIVNLSGTVLTGLTAGTGITLTGTSSVPIVNISGSVVTGITAGTGITVTGSAPSPTVALTSSSMTIGGQSISLGGTTTNQGNGAKLQLSTGSTTNGHCVQFDGNGNTVDAGGACTTGGGGGTVTSGTAGQITGYSSTGTTVVGLPNETFVLGALTLGQTTGPVAGSLTMFGATSGSTVLQPTAAAGSTTLTLPAATDTLVGKATTDTLTNKTLTAPVIATISNSGTLTLPTGTDTLVGRATTDTLTNKSIAASEINSGTLAAAQMPALTGDITTSAGAVSTTLATVNSNVGSFTNANITVNAKGLITAAANGTGGAGTVLRSYIAGCVLSNDGGTPTTKLDIAACQATDSTNAVYISPAAFTKTISGAWVAGTGNAGMGNGLSASASTWYHVFAIINNGSADIYFDTSVSAANAPASTTAFRRIGSIMTDGSAHILAFKQDEDTFYWGTQIQDVTAQSIGSSSSLLVLTVPVGVKVRPLIRALNDSTSKFAIFTSPDETDVAPTAFSSGAPDFDLGITSTSGTGDPVYTGQLYTDTLGRIRARANANSANIDITTRGWIDSRGRFN